MAEFRHGALRIEAPDNWTDDTALIVSGPIDPASMTQPQVRFALTRMEPDNTHTAAEVGGLLADQIPQAIEGATLLERRAAPLQGLDGFLLVYQAPLDGGRSAVRFHLFATRGSEMITGSTECLGEQYERLGPQLVRILESLCHVR